jgi:hypothetical protein
MIVAVAVIFTSILITYSFVIFVPIRGKPHHDSYTCYLPPQRKDHAMNDDESGDPWASERPLDPRIPDHVETDLKLIAVVPLPAASTEWLGTVRSYLSDGHSMRAAVMAANIAYPLS